jgi:hypothetical protein
LEFGGQPPGVRCVTAMFLHGGFMGITCGQLSAYTIAAQGMQAVVVQGASELPQN